MSGSLTSTDPPNTTGITAEGWCERTKIGRAHV